MKSSPRDSEVSDSTFEVSFSPEKLEGTQFLSELWSFDWMSDCITAGSVIAPGETQQPSSKKTMESEDWDILMKKFNIAFSLPQNKHQSASRIVRDPSLLNILKGVSLADKVSNLPHRDWYGNLLNIHTLRAENLRLGELPTNRFDRRLCLVQEHFKFLVLAVCCLTFNVDPVSLTTPLDDESLITQYLPRPEESEVSQGRPKVNKERVYNRAPNSLESQLSVNEEVHLYKSPRWMSFRPMPRSKDPLVVAELPDASNNKWLEGLIWKGVYFRLVCRAEGLALVDQMNVLKSCIHKTVKQETYKIENFSLVCHDLAVMQLADMGSWFLFATPVVSSESKSLQSPSQSSSAGTIYNHGNISYKVSLETRTLALDYKCDQLTKAYLHLFFLVRLESPKSTILGMMRKNGQDTADVQTLMPQSISSYFWTSIPKIRTANLRKFVSMSVLKSYKGHSIDSICGLISNTVRPKQPSDQSGNSEASFLCLTRGERRSR